MSTDKTLADVQPGGRVRLGDRATQEMVDAGASALLAYRKSGGDYTVHPTHAAEAAINAALSVRRCCGGERCAGHSALSAQPSLGGQGDAWDIAELVRTDLDRQSCPDAYMRIAMESVVNHLAARQPVGEPVFRERSTHKVYRGSCGNLPCHCWADTDHIVGDEVKRYATQPAQAVDLGAVREALQAAEGLATVCASVDGYSREEVAASGRAMKQQFADALAKIDSKAVGK